MVYNWRSLLPFILPNLCLLCARTLGGEALLCDACNRDCPRPGKQCGECGQRLSGSGTACHCLQHPPPVDRVYAMRSFEYPVRQMIHALKYQGRLLVCREAGMRIADGMAECCGRLPDALVPVPMHPESLRFRGYNQALEISRCISRRLAIPLLCDVVYRNRKTAPQSGLSPAERRRNLRGAFSLRYEPACEHIAIIDDVYTTGSTASEIARLLKRGPVRRVESWNYALA